MSQQPPAIAPDAARPRTVACPACQTPCLYSPEQVYRPFCSARCRGADLGAWASEQFKVTPDSTPTL